MITLILYLKELNSIRSNSLNFSLTPFTSSIMMLLSSSLPMNFIPKNLAAFTRASSSGDEELYDDLPFC